MIVGIDFDNTLANYDSVFVLLAREHGLLPPEFVGGKKAVRQALLSRVGGESAWMRLQGLAYGIRISMAQVAPRSREFIALCRARGVTVYIVSHKTARGHFDSGRTDLRAAARGWLETKGFFGQDGAGLDRDAVFFEETRAAKVDRIARLGCTHFVDDLPEVFAEPGFPATAEPLLLDNAGVQVAGRVRVFQTFDQIANALFPA